jgi:hypothetical protein
MRLADLDATFLGNYTESPTSYRQLDSVEGAQGVMFQCPKCAEGKERGEEDGRRFVRGAHSIICWFANPRNAPKVPDDASPKPGRWYFTGDSIDSLTFTGPGACSVLLTSGCGWHGFVKDGDAT